MQNYKVERELIQQVSKHENRYNKTVKYILNFKNSNEIINEYFQNIA
ncbi:hypothetical protein [Miniphocaeibacter sp.]